MKGLGIRKKNILSEMGERMRCVISAKVWESERDEWDKKGTYWDREVYVEKK